MGTNEEAPIEVLSYTLFDASIGYQMDNWQLRLTARNITDEGYISGCGVRGCDDGER
jgi:iron complex outermembrane receptor protein